MLGSTKINSAIKRDMVNMTSVIEKLVSGSRRFTIGMDCWSKKGLTASFLGISASFYNPEHRLAFHFLLNLFQIAHPHTGEMIAEKLCQCLQQWGIEQRRVIMVVTDNGANMIKAVRVAAPDDIEEAEQSTTDSEADDDGNMDDNSLQSQEDSEVDGDEIENNGLVELDESDGISAEFISLHRFPCMAHTLQLVLKGVEHNVAYAKVLSKARGIVRKIRISSVATEKMVTLCGKTVVAECTTRWNSNMFMIERLLLIKDHLAEVCKEMKWDCFLASEWVKLDELYQILKPFTDHTNVMQTDKFALSNVIPVLLDLSAHLSNSTLPVARLLKISLLARFDILLNPDNPQFDPIPSAACLLDPSVASMLQTTDTTRLLAAAKSYILETREVKTAYQ